MNIKEGKYTHKVILQHYRGHTVTRYTNDPETRGEVLMDHGYKPLEGQTELLFEQINPVMDTVELEPMIDTANSFAESNVELDETA
jgi:hypothetical protein|tara:strand:- start:1938 stop:2195 length:258 start_codon:yes stop_codon:yes gene_type:complete